MDKLNFIIAENLKRFRGEKKLSLDNVAKLTCVSKSMLGQIERGEVNPTVSTIWKIANGLKISCTELMSMPEADFEIVDKSQVQPLVEDNGRVRIFPAFSFDSTRRFEIYSLEIDSAGYLSTEAHQQGTQEFITVFSGKLSITVNGEEFVIKTGNSIRFKADCIHAYKNTCDEICTLNMVIYYPM
ncbi:helix-turn-helix transcriptional regulator [Clostridium sp. PL3]|uniref:Helix-turn-helix transcriptional regulator n=1 Tax=Clostridium thailandense TaxID=2794346 RepID=A0A949WRU0_9CLOT|nr:XRE family transcriptional regulator [Clostridium thailandense]MBV7274356.1 helix-turn-helix transcriptional regulator [Clostridium thailandense]